MRNFILGLLFLVLLVGVSGCQTIKYTAKGVGSVDGGIRGLGKSLVTDAKSIWAAVERADAWVEENYW